MFLPPIRDEEKGGGGVTRILLLHTIYIKDGWMTIQWLHIPSRTSVWTETSVQSDKISLLGKRDSTCVRALHLNDFQTLSGTPSTRIGASPPARSPPSAPTPSSHPPARQRKNLQMSLPPIDVQLPALWSLPVALLSLNGYTKCGIITSLWKYETGQ